MGKNTNVIKALQFRALAVLRKLMGMIGNFHIPGSRIATEKSDRILIV
jgi:hypothetical protein